MQGRPLPRGRTSTESWGGRGGAPEMGPKGRGAWGQVGRVEASCWAAVPLLQTPCPSHLPRLWPLLLPAEESDSCLKGQAKDSVTEGTQSSVGALAGRGRAVGAPRLAVSVPPSSEWPHSLGSFPNPLCWGWGVRVPHPPAMKYARSHAARPWRPPAGNPRHSHPGPAGPPASSARR